MNFKEFKELALSKRNRVPEEYLKFFDRELKYSERYYNNGRDLFAELTEKKPKKATPLLFALGFCDSIEDTKLEMVQVKSGASGGIDIDSDFSPDTKEKVFEFLRNKYGEDRVLHVGTYSKLGLKSAAKDLLRVYNVGTFEQNNRFTAALSDEAENWDEALELLKETKKDQYDYYLHNKSVLDLMPHFMNKIRQVGKHAGGVVILDKPIYEYAPVERVQDEFVTAYEESANTQSLDEIGLIKLDILSISVLETIADTISQISEDLFLVEDDDGIVKVLPRSMIPDDLVID